MRIMVLSTWFPYPLSQGSKIRAYHLIKALARQHEVALVSFAEEPLQPGWLEHMRGICARVEVVEHNPFMKNRLRSLIGWVLPVPSAIYAGYSADMERCVLQTAQAWKPELVLALTVITAPYALKVPQIRRVLDIDNILSRYLREVYEQQTGLVRRARAWAAWQKFHAYEGDLFHRFELCLNVSEADVERVRQGFSIPEERLEVIPNGVDLDTMEMQPFVPEPASLVFNGALTYDANRDAMQYFIEKVYPLIRQQVPDAYLRITGKLDGVATGWVPANGSVELTGYLEDVRPVVGRSWACVVPLRLGAGTRLKVLEAMALGVPVISTSKGIEGLDAKPGVHLLTGDTPEEFAAQTLRVLCDIHLRERLADEARALVQEQYGWVPIGERLCARIAQLKV